MTDADFDILTSLALSTARACTPRATGNLAELATKKEARGNRVTVIYVDTGIAPYFKYVNNREKLGEKNNPNYRYWNRAVDSVVNDIAAALGGMVVK